MPLHTAHDRRATGQIQQQAVLCIGERSGQVTVHLGEAWEQVMSSTVDTRCGFRDRCRGAGSKRRDQSRLNDDGLSLEHALCVHRNDVDVDERVAAADGHLRKRCAREQDGSEHCADCSSHRLSQRETSR